MDRQAAVRIIKDTFEKSFDKGRFVNFSKNLVNYLDASKSFTYQGDIIPDAYRRSIQSLERIGKYEDTEDEVSAEIIATCSICKEPITSDEQYYLFEVIGSLHIEQVAIVSADTSSSVSLYF